MPSVGAQHVFTTTLEHHEHEWRLSSVEFDDGASVLSFECAHCPDVVFR